MSGDKPKPTTVHHLRADDLCIRDAIIAEAKRRPKQNTAQARARAIIVDLYGGIPRAIAVKSGDLVKTVQKTDATLKRDVILRAAKRKK
jgi:hypothetical protein